MEHSELCVGRVAIESLTHQSPMGRSARRARLGVIGLGVLGTFIAQDALFAQAGTQRLTVRPKTMATATTNPKAGEYPLKTVEDVLVTVPEKCVGAHRCPMFIALPGAGYGARQMSDWIGPVAKKYGFILLASSEPAAYDVGMMDAQIKETIKRFAVEPDKIAIMGRCASGASGMQFGLDNPDVFSRVASVSGGVPTDGVDPKAKSQEFFIDRGFLEAGGNFQAAADLQSKGHNVQLAFALRGHEHQAEDYDFLGHWLQESWAKPNPSDRPAPAKYDAVALTPEVLTQMTSFWTAFAKEPDSIRAKARRATLHDVAIPAGKAQGSVWITDMVALAAKYPSVEADLKGAGLTAQQEDADRVSLISAQATKAAGDEPGAPEAGSVLAKNVSFLDTHLAEMKKLRVAGITNMDQVMEVNQTATITEPKLADDIGFMGIWRTP